MDSHLYTLSVLGLKGEKNFNSNLRDDAEESGRMLGANQTNRAKVERKKYERENERASEREREKENERGTWRRKEKRTIGREIINQC